MDPRIQRALEIDRIVDITTIGRTTGRPRRIEMRCHNVGGQLFLTGTPGIRGWYANLLAHPEFVLHLKGHVRADLRARAAAVVEPTQRRAILSRLLDRRARANELEAWIRESPLATVTILEAKGGSGSGRPPAR